METESNTATQPAPAPRKMMSDDIGKLAAALAIAQGEMEGAKKTAKNPFFKSNYADLQSVWDAVRAPLSKNGLCIIQTVEGSELVTTLCHSSGQWIRGALVMTPQKKDPQGIGSAITYARRYSVEAICGIGREDDDGEAAMGRGRKEARKKSTQKPVEADVLRLKKAHDDGVLEQTFKAMVRAHPRERIDALRPTVEELRAS